MLTDVGRVEAKEITTMTTRTVRLPIHGNELGIKLVEDPSTATRVMVQSVRKGSLAVREGIRPGWIVVGVDGNDVTTADLWTVVTRIREALSVRPVQKGRVIALTFLRPDDDRVAYRTRSSQNNRKPNSKDADGTGLRNNRKPNSKDADGTGLRNNRKPNSKFTDVTGLVLFLSQQHTNGRLNKGAIEEAVVHFPFKRSSIQRIWRKARPGVLDPDVVVDLAHRKKGQSGRKRKYETKDLEAVATVPISDRTTLRSLSFVIDIPRTSLWRFLKSGHILCHSSTLKPFLTEKNKEARLNFSRSFVDENGIFMDMMEYVHLDKK